MTLYSPIPTEGVFLRDEGDGVATVDGRCRVVEGALRKVDGDDWKNAALHGGPQPRKEWVLPIEGTDLATLG